MPAATGPKPALKSNATRPIEDVIPSTLAVTAISSFLTQGTEQAPAADLRVLRWLLLVGSVALGAIWAFEAWTGVIAEWDRWFYPLLIVVFVASSTVLFVATRWVTAARVAANVTLNAYLVAAFHLALFAGDGPVAQYSLATVGFWMPLGLGCTFMFLGLRAGIAVSALTISGWVLPIVVATLVGAPAHWTSELAPLLMNLGLAQLTFVVMMIAISRLRDGYYRAQERAGLMRALAVTDVLTGLPNRRALSDGLAAQLALAHRGTQALSVVLIDVDHFKGINDRHGHAAGDAVLAQLGVLLQSHVRASDRVGRWGGEEFLVIAPGTTEEAAVEVSERVRQAVAAWPFAHDERVTLSLGVAEAKPGDGIDSLLHRADRALYGAKKRGRNRVETQALATSL